MRVGHAIGQGSTLNLNIGERCLRLNQAYLWAEIVVKLAQCDPLFENSWLRPCLSSTMVSHAWIYIDIFLKSVYSCWSGKNPFLSFNSFRDKQLITLEILLLFIDRKS